MSIRRREIKTRRAVHLDLKHRLADETFECLKAIALVADGTSTEAYLVGSMVRELAHGYSTISTSPDIVVIGDASEFADALASAIPDCSIISTSQFHTLKVSMHDRIVDIATARSDTYETSGALPHISLVDDIETDLARRDFTLNAMAFRLNPQMRGTLIDPFDGLSDAQVGIVRVLRENSFWEDPLRMLRGARLAARYGYRFAPETADEIRKSGELLTQMLVTSPQRVSNEWRLWFNDQEKLDAIVASARHLGLLAALGLDDDVDAERIAWAGAGPLERFAAFAYISSPASVAAFANHLVMPSEWRTVASDVETVRDVAERCRRYAISNSSLYRALIDVHDEAIQGAIVAEPEPTVINRLAQFRDQLKGIRPALSGSALIELGVPVGPEVGRLLEELRDMRIEGTVASAEDERQHVISRLRTCFE